MNKTSGQFFGASRTPAKMFIRITKIAFLILFFLFTGKNLFSNNSQIENILHIIDYAFWLGGGICLLIITGAYTYYAWALDAKSFRDWYASQKLYIWQAAWVYEFPKLDVVRLWVNRLFAPLGFFLGIAIIIITLFVAFSP